MGLGGVCAHLRNGCVLPAQPSHIILSGYQPRAWCCRNLECSDCSSRSTCWVSVCLQCSAAAPGVGDSRDTVSVDRQTLCAEVPSDDS